MKICKACKVPKELYEFHPCGQYKEKIYYRGECRECNSKLQSSNQSAQIKYRNSERGRAIKSAYKKTKEYKIKELKYEKDRRKRDPLYKCKKNVRDRLNKALKVKKWLKHTHFSEYIGCSQDELKIHIETKFTEGMTWDNYGFGEGFWNIDHIIPLSSAQSEEEMYKLCHFSNLQPLWHKDNQKKSNKT